MTRYFTCLLLCVSLIFLPVLSLSRPVPEFTLLTEDWKPYNFKKDQTIKGIAVDLLVAMLKQTGSKQTREDIKLIPWPRGYELVLKEPKTVLFSMTRTRDREELFKWVGPIDVNKTELIAKKESHIKVNSINDLSSYAIGTIYNDVGEQLLLSKGVPLNNLQQVVNRESNQHKLHTDRIDMIVGSFIGHMYYSRAAGYDPDDYESVFVLNSAEIYYAFHRETSDAIIQLFQNALDDLKADGTYLKIVNSYRN